jgi:hypothetical protein
MTLEEHIQALNALTRAEHERFIAVVQSWADEAAAVGDVRRHRRHLAHVAELRAVRLPGETSTAA